MRLTLFIRMVLFAMILTQSACDLIIPPDPPLEPKALKPNDYAWDQLELTQTYDYIDVARVDCSKMLSVLTGSGKCLPVKLSVGSAIECPLTYPGKKMEMACLSDQNTVPAIYVRFEWDASVANLDLKQSFGACKFVSAGPAAGESPRYQTDTGFKACLFDEKAPYSVLHGDVVSARPSGLYLDISENPSSLAQLESQVSSVRFSAPAILTLDARFLNEKERIQALKDTNMIFSFYRGFADHSE